MLNPKELFLLLRKKKRSPEYTRRQWIMKAIQLYISAIGMDLSGCKLAEIEVNYAYNKISAAEAYGPMYIYYCALHGLFFALSLWRLLEIYWWGKDHVKIESCDT